MQKMAVSAASCARTLVYRLTRQRRINLYLTLLSILVLSTEGCVTEPAIIQDSNAVVGRIQFETHCAACHQPDGSGAVGGGPPLADSPWVSGPPSRLIRLVLQGVRGPIVVRGETYNREMIGFGQVATDKEIAALLTYVRGQWGGIEERIRPEAVGRIRKATASRIGYWTVEELLEIP